MVASIRLGMTPHPLLCMNESAVTDAFLAGSNVSTLFAAAAVRLTDSCCCQLVRQTFGQRASASGVVFGAKTAKSSPPHGPRPTARASLQNSRGADPARITSMTPESQSPEPEPKPIPPLTPVPEPSPEPPPTNPFPPPEPSA